MTPLDTLLVVAPVFLTVGAGALAVKTEWFRDDHVDGLMNFGQNFAIPCLLFRAISKVDLVTAFDVDLLVAFYGGSALCFIIGAVGAWLLFARRGGDAVVLGFSSLYCNAILLGLPITERAFGTAGSPANLAIIAFQAPVCYLIGITAMEVSRSGDARAHQTAIRTLKALARQPNMIALALGIAANVIRVPLPGIATITLDMIGGAALPASLFALGGVMCRFEMRGSLSATMFVTAISLLVRPAIVLGLSALVFHLPLAALRAAVVTAAMAPGVNSYLFAHSYQQGRDVAAGSILLATALSVLTVALWITMLS